MVLKMAVLELVTEIFLNFDENACDRPPMC